MGVCHVHGAKARRQLQQRLSRFSIPRIVEFNANGPPSTRLWATEHPEPQSPSQILEQGRVRCFDQRSLNPAKIVIERHDPTRVVMGQEGSDGVKLVPRAVVIDSPSSYGPFKNCDRVRRFADQSARQLGVGLVKRERAFAK